MVIYIEYQQMTEKYWEMQSLMNQHKVLLCRSKL